MSRRAHVKILLIASAIWLAFWVAGLPDYYQQYAVGTMVVFSVLLLLPVVLVLDRVLRRQRRSRRMAVALWLAFYLTVPLALYDSLYCGLYLGHGVSFLTRYWYLSVYYVIPWVVTPLIAALRNRAPHPRPSAGEGA